MSIDYKKEVDSGIDRKIMVEKTIMNLLKDGISADIITESEDFNPRHREMLHNLQAGYVIGEEEMRRIYGDFLRDDIPNEAGTIELSTDPVHDYGELYPMKKEEENEMFTLRDKINNDINIVIAQEIQEIKKEIKSISSKMLRFRKKHPELDRILLVNEELEEIEKNNGNIDSNVVMNLLQKYELTKYKTKDLDLTYNDFLKLTENYRVANEKLTLAQQGKLDNPTIIRLIQERTMVENEIFQRNLKLVNYVIRNYCKGVLVDQDDLHQILSIEMYNAIKRFDIKLGNRFSTYAVPAMRFAYHRNFKSLTGYHWEKYWKKRELQKTIETVTELMGKRPSIEELSQLGFLDVSQDEAKKLLNSFETLLDTYVFKDTPFTEDLEDAPMDFDDYEKLDEYEDYRYGFNSTDDDEVEEDAIFTILQDNIHEILETLTDREREVIILRYGLGGDTPKTLEEVGREFKITRERVRQIEAKALRKLKNPIRRKRLESFHM